MLARQRLQETARRAGIASFIAVSCAAFALVWAAFTNDFSVAYILHHTNIALNSAYKFSALWSGQEGSLLLWAWLLAAYGFVLRLRHRVDVRLSRMRRRSWPACRSSSLLLLNFAAPPFSIEPGPIRRDGYGLNPLLQYPEMVIHPPMLYLGYVGFSVPFAFALGALMMRYPGEKWIHITRRWTMVTWLFLTCGIFLGAHWAYCGAGLGRLLGMGSGRERHLDAVADGHRLSALGDDAGEARHDEELERLADLLDVHADDAGNAADALRPGELRARVRAESTSATGSTCSCCIVFAVCLFTFFQQRDHLKSENKLESLVSREVSFLFNNLMLLVACFTVLWGTLFPVLSEYVQGTKVTWARRSTTGSNMPIGLFLLMLTGVGPLLAWRSTSLRTIRRNFILPWRCACRGAAIGLMIAGVRPWSAPATTGRRQLFSLLAFSLGAGVITAISAEFLRGANVVRDADGQESAARRRAR